MPRTSAMKKCASGCSASPKRSAAGGPSVVPSLKRAARPSSNNSSRSRRPSSAEPPVMPEVPVAFEPAFLEKLEESRREALKDLPRARKAEFVEELFSWSPEETLGRLLEASGLPRAEPADFDIEGLDRLPVRLVHEYHCVPLRAPAANGKLALATGWPPEPEMDDWVFASCGAEPEWHLALSEKIGKCITEHLGVGAESLDASIETNADLEEADQDEEDENAAVIRFVNQVVAQAVEDGATDIHFEPQEETLRIRYRIDGLLVTVPVPDNLRRFQDAITSRLKIMAKLNISERRLPQDGRINYRAGSAILDIRLSTIPTMYGESVSLRLLNKKSQPLTLDELGMSRHDQEEIGKVLALPHGIILVTGPTGSGKSTSLNAFIRQINSVDQRIITIEDPIEYEVPGVNQIQVRPEIGFGFAEALRHVLRQDPNIIMVGEIRDRNTADIAIRASLTGHLVFSTIHTNDAPGAITRLTDMGIEPFLIASGVEMVIAQRLVRRLCRNCVRQVPFDRELLRATLRSLEVDTAEADRTETLPEPAGCESCRQLGYRGRVGLFEILRVDETFHELIVKRESARAIRKLGLEHGMQTLERSGWSQIRAGLTSLEEVVRIVSMNDSGE
ncbi:MAG: type II/IV secretion system protein [Puniceicoccaceae bacterium]|nr:MAG: type II/IV secretion system protein [Puniceicoccaceae bacterium]